MFLSIAFFVTALLYACAGFGGGSTYNALLVLSDVDYKALPFIALTCNIIVVSGGVWHFSRGQHINIKDVLPWVVFSIPAAWVGGYINISEIIFIGLLGVALFFSSVKMLWPEKESFLIQVKHNSTLTDSRYVPYITGAFLGLLAGLTGIGGGIFLAPVLYFLRQSHPKKIAGTCSLFIFVNSLAGLLGQSLKLGEMGVVIPTFQSFWYLFPAVLVGGQIGSRLGAYKIDVGVVKKTTALLILYVSLRLLYQFWVLL